MFLLGMRFVAASTQPAQQIMSHGNPLHNVCGVWVLTNHDNK
jgi:hypothetical protein